MANENLRQVLKGIADSIRDRLDIPDYPIQPINFAEEIVDIPQSSGGGHYQDPADILEGTISYCSNSASFIKPYTFGFCYELSEADFSKCKTIGSRAFESCSALSAISFPVCEEIGSYTFMDCPKLSEVSFPECKIIYESAFFNDSKVTNISLPNCEIIGSHAFAGCSYVSSVYLPNCKIVHNNAFSWASNSTLSAIDLPQCLSFSGGVLYYPTNLSYINLPRCLAVYFYVPWSSIVQPSSITINFPNMAFRRTQGVPFKDSPSSVYCPNLIQGGDCFTYWSNLSYVSLPNLLNGHSLFKLVSSTGLLSLPLINRVQTDWNHYADVSLSACGSLTALSLPNLTTIEQSGFCLNPNLSSIYLPALYNVGSSGFSGCTNLSEVFFPAVGYFYNHAFSGCTRLEKVTILNPLARTNSSAFLNTPIADSSYLGYFGSIYVLPSRVDYYKSSAGWSRYKDRITAIPESTMIELASQYIFFSEFMGSTLSEIPNERLNIKQILSSGFKNCTNLTSIYLPECEIVGSQAFQGCSNLSQVSLPKCKYTRTQAFSGCNALSSIYLPQVLYTADAFAGCSNLLYASLPECRWTGDTFNNCSNLRYIYLPKCLSLNTQTFINCSNLSYVVFRDLLAVPFSQSEHRGNFANCSNLWSVYVLGSNPIWFYSYTYIPNSTVPSIKTFLSTPITSLTYSEATGQSEYGKIYVRASLVSDFKILNSMYSEIQDRFVGLTDEEADTILNTLDNGGQL